MPSKHKIKQSKPKGKSAKVGAGLAKTAFKAAIRSITGNEKKNRIIKLNIEAKIKKNSDLFSELAKIVRNNRTNTLKSRYNINIGQFIFYADHKDFGLLFDEVKNPDLKKIIISNYVKYFNKTSLRYKDSNKNSTTKKIVILYDGTDSYFKKIQQFNSAIADFLATGFLATGFLANGLPYTIQYRVTKLEDGNYTIYYTRQGTVEKNLFGFKENAAPFILLGTSDTEAPLNFDKKKTNKLTIKFNELFSSYLLLYTEALEDSKENIHNNAYSKDKKNHSRKLKDKEIHLDRIKPKEKISTQIRLPSANRVNTMIHQGLSIPVLGPNGYQLFGQTPGFGLGVPIPGQGFGLGGPIPGQGFGGQGFGGQGQGFGGQGQTPGFGLGGQGQTPGFGLGGQTPGFGLGGQGQTPGFGPGPIQGRPGPIQGGPAPIQGQGGPIKNEFLQQSNYPDFQNIGGPILTGSKKKSNSRNKPRKQSKKKNKSKK